MTSIKLRKLGFCGADDSVSPNALALIFNAYPFVEFGVLFRPDKVRRIYCTPRGANMNPILVMTALRLLIFTSYAHHR